VPGGCFTLSEQGGSRARTAQEAQGGYAQEGGRKDDVGRGWIVNVGLSSALSSVNLVRGNLISCC
jgi:hypothetical protein